MPLSKLQNKFIDVSRVLCLVLYLAETLFLTPVSIALEMDPPAASASGAVNSTSGATLPPPETASGSQLSLINTIAELLSGDTTADTASGGLLPVIEHTVIDFDTNGQAVTEGDSIIEDSFVVPSTDLPLSISGTGFELTDASQEALADTKTIKTGSGVVFADWQNKQSVLALPRGDVIDPQFLANDDQALPAIYRYLREQHVISFPDSTLYYSANPNWIIDLISATNLVKTQMVPTKTIEMLDRRQYLFTQQIDHIPVLGEELSLTIATASGQILSLNGDFHDLKTDETQTTIYSLEQIVAGLKEAWTQHGYQWETDQETALFAQPRPVYYDATWRNGAQDTLTTTDKPHNLAARTTEYGEQLFTVRRGYEFKTTLLQPFGTWQVVVDAETGQIVRSYNTTLFEDETAPLLDQASTSGTILPTATADSSSGSQMADTTASGSDFVAAGSDFAAAGSDFVTGETFVAADDSVVEQIIDYIVTLKYWTREGHLDTVPADTVTIGLQNPTEDILSDQFGHFSTTPGRLRSIELKNSQFQVIDDALENRAVTMSILGHTTFDNIYTEALPVEDTNIFARTAQMMRWATGSWPWTPAAFTIHNNSALGSQISNSAFTLPAKHEIHLTNIQQADVIWHEVGHLLSEASPGLTVYNTETMSLREGLADYLAWAIPASAVASGAVLPAIPQPELTANCTKTLLYYEAHPDLTYIGPCAATTPEFTGNLTGEPHADGKILLAVWTDLAQELGVDQATRLIGDTLAIPTDRWEIFLYNMLVADDSLTRGGNNNLSDGTPHLSTILDIYYRHGIGPGSTAWNSTWTSLSATPTPTDPQQPLSAVVCHENWAAPQLCGKIKCDGVRATDEAANVVISITGLSTGVNYRVYNIDPGDNKESYATIQDNTGIDEDPTVGTFGYTNTSGVPQDIGGFWHQEVWNATGTTLIDSCWSDTDGYKEGWYVENGAPVINSVTENDSDNYVTNGTSVTLTVDTADYPRSCQTFWDSNTSYGGSELSLGYGNTDGHCSSTVTTPDSTDGTWYYCVRANSLYSNTYACTNAMTYDESAPSTPTISYDDGYHITSSQNITFSATDSQSGIASYTLYYRTATLSAEACGTYGSWTSLGTQTSPYSHSMSTATCYQYYVTATNGVGLSTSSSTSPTATTMVDVTAPNTPSLSYTNGYNTSGSQSITFSSSDSQSGINYYNLYYQTATLSDGTCGTFGSWTSFGQQVSPYNHTLTSGYCYRYYVRAYNNAGLSYSSSTSPTSVTKVDTSAPTVTSTTEDDSDNIVTNGTSVTITSDGADTVSGLSTCVAYWDANTAYAGTETSLGDLGTDCDGTVTTPDSTDGTWYYCVRPVNNASLTNYSCTSAVTYDETPPTITSITSVAGDTAATYYDTSDDSSTSIVFVSSGAATCKWDATDTTYASMANTCASTTNCVANLSGNGSKTVYLRCADAAGNPMTTSTSVTYVIDSTLPTSTVTIANAYYGTNFAHASTINGTAADTNGITAVAIQISNGTNYWTGSAWGSATWLAASGTTTWTYTIDDANFTSGATYTITSRATDGAGNVQTSYGSDSFIYDGTAPTVSGSFTLTAGANSYLSGNTLWINNNGGYGYVKATFTDNVNIGEAMYVLLGSDGAYSSDGSTVVDTGYVDGNRYVLYSGGQAGTHAKTTTSHTTEFQVTGNNIAEETRTLQFYNYDAYSNGSGWLAGSTTKYVGTDSSVPTTTVGLSGTAGSNGWYTSNVTATLTPADARSGVASNYLCTDTGTACTPASGTSLSVTTESATNYVRYYSIDNVGNTQTTQVSSAIKIDKTAPTATSTTENDADNYVTNGTSVTITSDGADAVSGVATCVAYWDANTAYAGTETSLGDLGTDCDGAVTTPDSTDGTWYYCVRPVDSAGLSNYSCTNAVTYDENPPTITSITSVAGDTAATYYDTSDDSSTAIVFVSSGAATCKWDSTDTTYASMANTCASTTNCVANLSGNGSKTVYLRCIDAAGNPMTTSTSVAYTIDSVAPTTPGAMTTTWVGDHYINTSFAASTTGSTDATSGIRGYRLCRSVDNTSGCNTWVTAESTNTTVTVDGTHLPSNGAYRYYYWYAYDNAGNLSSASTAVYIRMDSSSPTSLNVTSSSEYWKADGITAGQLTAVATDGGSGVTSLSTQITNVNLGSGDDIFNWQSSAYTYSYSQIACTGGGYASQYRNPTTNYISLTACTTTLNSGQRTVIFSITPNGGGIGGQVSVTEEAIDNLNQNAQQSFTNLFTFDPEAPMAWHNITAGTYYGPNTYAANSTISGSALDNDSFIDTIHLTIQESTTDKYWNGSGWQTDSIELEASGSETWSYSLESSNFTTGRTYTITAYAYDGAGWISDPAVTNFIWDGTAPSTPTVTDDGLTTNSTTQLHTTWSSTDETSAIADNEYCINTSATDTSNCTSGAVVTWTSTSTTQSVTKTGLTLSSNTTYYFHVRTTNGAGTVSSIGHSDGILIDTTLPTVSVKSVDIDTTIPYWDTFNDSSTGIALTASDTSGIAGCRLNAGTSVTDYDDMNIWGSWDSENNHWSLMVSGLTEGSYTYTYACKDNAGNKSAGQSLNFGLDWTTPWTANAPITTTNAYGNYIKNGYTMYSTGWTETGSTITECYFCNAVAPDTTCSAWSNIGTSFDSGTSTCTKTSAPCTDGQVLTLQMGAQDEANLATPFNATPTITRTCDNTSPARDEASTTSAYWKIDGTSTYTITLKATDNGVGIGGDYPMMALINESGDNSANPRGYFAWKSDGYVFSEEQMACSGGGYGSKANYLGDTYITLVSCSTSLSGNQRTVNFVVQPHSNFGDFTNNDISEYTSDNLKNESGWTNFNVNFITDGSAPSTPTVTDDGTTTTSTTQLHATWTSTDETSAIADNEYCINTSATDTSNCTSGAVVTWTSTSTTQSVTKTGLTLSSNTTYYFHVRTTNGVGIVSTIGHSDGILVDNDAPTVTVNQAGGQDDPTKNSPINFTVVFNEAINPSSFTETDVTITGTAGGTKTVNLSTSDNITWTAAVSGMTEGTVIASIAADSVTDVAGNNNLASTSTDHTVTYDTTLPSSAVTIANAYYGTGFAHASTINGTAADTNGISAVAIQISNGTNYWTGSAWGSATWLAASGTTTWTYTIDDANFTSGATYTITSRATDSAGNVQTSYGTDSFIYDTSAPTGGAVSIDSGANYTTTPTGHTLNITCPTDDWAPVEMAYGNAAAPTNWTTCTTTVATYDLGTGDGTKTVYVRFRDAGGNTTTDSTDTIILDTGTPDIVALTAGASSTNRNTLTTDTWFNYVATGSDDQLSLAWTDPGSASDDTFYYELTTSAANAIDDTDSSVTNPYLDNVSITEGTTYFHVRPRNGAGTWGTERSFIIKYDQSAPSSATITWGGSTATSVNFSISGSTDTRSGLATNYIYCEYDNNAQTFASADGNSGWVATTNLSYTTTANTDVAIRCKTKDSVDNETAWVYPTPAYETTTGGTLTISSPSTTLSFGALAVAATTQASTLSLGSSSDYFSVSDQVGEDTGYQTTIQSSDLTTTGSLIPSSAVQIHLDSSNPIVLSGTTNARVTLNTALTTGYTSLNNAINLIGRAAGTNNGVTGEYGVQPTLRVNVPGFQRLGEYTGVITYTIVE